MKSIKFFNKKYDSIYYTKYTTLVKLPFRKQFRLRREHFQPELIRETTAILTNSYTIK